MPVFHSEQWVAVELAQVFAFFSDPRNLPRLMPEASHPRLERLDIVSPPGQVPGKGVVAGPGSEIEISFRVLPFLPVRARWLARILEFECNAYFVDTQLRGPFQRWDHRHEFIAQERSGRAGTLIRDHVEYEIDYGVLGALAAGMIKRRIALMFRERAGATERLLRP